MSSPGDTVDSATRRLAIVMPVLNEAAGIEQALAALQPLRARGAQVIVVDGGSSDDTVARAGGADFVLVAERGRARQMNVGARRADADVLLFLHADTRLPADADRHIGTALVGGACWGRHSRWLNVVAAMMNWRSHLTGICTGDQALFARREFFETLDGFPDQPLMEDIEWSRRARSLSRPAVVGARATTSGRRWEQRGLWRTIALMWSLRWRYFLGADPAVLARRYREVR